MTKELHVLDEQGRAFYAAEQPDAPEPQAHRQQVQVDALDDDWRVTYALEQRNDTTIITGITITPAADAFHEWPPACGTAPDQGLTARRVRGLKLGPAQVRRLTRLPDGLDLSGMGPALRAHLEHQMPVRTAGRPGSSGRSDVHYLEVAVAYLEAIGAGSPHPVMDAASATGYSRTYTRDMVSGARDRGLLTRPRTGLPGGRLTARAWRALADDPDLLERARRARRS
jgi:hypothetical protein